jgi:cobalt-zinc-cadmium resistance protein CzcA
VLRVGDVAMVRTGSLTRYGAVTRMAKAKRCRALSSPARGRCQRRSCRRQGALDEVQTSLPKGMSIDVFYDRSDLIGRAVGTVEKALAGSDRAGGHPAAALSGRSAGSLIVALALCRWPALLTFIFMRPLA